MGIPGLTSFIDDNPHLLTDHDLCDTKVVIDGNNLYHFLYNYYEVDNVFGGDYDTFRECIRKYFQKLISCKIEAHVIFDGAYHPDDRKLKTSLSRAQNQIILGGSIRPGDRGKILPVLAHETFRTVLDELHVKHMTCDYEADRQLTALANKYSCPVMSNDSDFFVYDIEYGFVLLDYVNLHVKSGEKDGEKTYYLKVQIYHLQTLLNYFPGCNKDIFPLFASILGNDYVPPEEFEIFFNKAHLPKASSKHLFYKPKRQSKFLSLLLWLEDEESREAAIESAMKYIPENKRKKLNELVRRSINEYVMPQTLLDFEDKKEKSTDCSLSTEIRSKGGHSPPNWLIGRARSGLIAPLCLNAIVSRRIIFKCQVENTVEISAYSCAEKLRGILYGLLLSIDKSAEEIQDEDMYITEYTRIRNELKKTKVFPVFVWDSVVVPPLHDIPKLSLESRKHFVLRFISSSEGDMDCFQGLVDDLLLPMLCVLYWIENSNPPVSDIHMKCLVLCMIFLWLKDEKAIGCFQKLDSYHDMATSDIVKLLKNLEKFRNPSKIVKFDRSVVHGYSQYQACLQAIVYINQLFMCPFPTPNPAIIMSGTFLYNLFRELKSRKCPDLYIEEMLGRTSTALKYYKSVVEMVTVNLSSAEKLLTMSGVTRKKKANKVARKKERSDFKAEKSNVLENSEDAVYDINNKFNVLMLDNQTEL